MRKKVKIALVICAVALVIGFGIKSNIALFIDPPYGLVNLK